MTPRLTILILAFTALAAWRADAQETNSRARWDDASFRFLAERNIFNPNRSPRSSRPVRSEGPSEAPARTESFALVGTIMHDNGRFAFFEGSSSDYRKVLPVDGAIAGYKVAEITSQDVTLSAEGEQIKLAVGSALRRRGNDPWQVGEAMTFAGPISSSSSSPTSSPSSPATPSATPAAAEDNDVLKRLLQKREQELSNEKR